MRTQGKLRLFLDADDVLLRSTEAVVDILNKRNVNLNAKPEDVVEWNYTSICPSMTADEVLKIYESTEFWETVRMDMTALELLLQLHKDTEIYVVSKGTDKNLKEKKKFLQTYLLHFDFIGLSLSKDETCFDKSCVDMSGPSIQVDDRTDCLLGTNATLKILLKNGADKPWNRYKGGESNLYIANNWKEVAEIIRFYNDNRELLTGVSCNA